MEKTIFHRELPPALLLDERKIPGPSGKRLSSRDLALWCARLLDHAEAEAADKKALRDWAAGLNKLEI